MISQLVDDEDLELHTLGLARTVSSYTAVGLRMTEEAMWANLDAPDLASCLALESRDQGFAGQTEEVHAYIAHSREQVSAPRRPEPVVNASEKVTIASTSGAMSPRAQARARPAP